MQSMKRPAIEPLAPSQKYNFSIHGAKIGKFIILSAPAIFILVLISKYCVDVPFWDEWDGIGSLVEKIAHGTLTLQDLFAQHNEHRIFFPRLIILPLVLLTHWDTNAVLYASWSLACLSSYSLYRLSRATFPRNSQQTF